MVKEEKKSMKYWSWSTKQINNVRIKRGSWAGIQRTGIVFEEMVLPAL